ncbi:CDP-glycerol glycerophosphotransferase family protein [Photobacterium kishitanii]|uniref:CDP-glycerol glycerophosphotransferase family protein n=1 Tax=Photobacterium kishitanii TaxID=318456 RepID=UPI00071AF11A|nr:CDP-glycerol glycerophosphotransferase family protein [Photobacterium kishitanii]
MINYKLIIKKIYFGVFFDFLKKIGVNERRIIFSSYYGEQISGDPKVIYEKIKSLGLDYECVWVNNKNTPLFDGDISVKRYSIQHLYFLATARYRIDNCQESGFLVPHEKTIYIQTWHGIPIKKIAQDIDDPKFKDIKKDWQLDATSWTYLLTSSQYTSDLLCTAFNIEKNKVIDFGYPRNDIFINKKNEEKIEKIREDLHLGDKKVILYAPTFRDGREYEYNLNLDLDIVSEKLPDNYIILVKMHSNVKNSFDINCNDIIDVSHYNDVQDLLLISDILVTDYSSIFIDFLLLNKKIIFFAYDFDDYISNCRDLYIDYINKVPGKIVFNTSELMDEILNNQKAINVNECLSQYYGDNIYSSCEKIMKKVGILC